MSAQANWCPLEVDYSKAIFPAARAWQVRALEGLRAGFRNGHRRQILCAATGSGKTLAALQLLHGSLVKGKYAIFVCDRTALINQTSARADSYGLPHGIVQAEHWRRDTSIPFQICSMQTIAARGYWPRADLIVVDECHSQFKAMGERILSTDAAVIGLTATPCTKGLGNLYTNLVSATTMHELTAEGILVPLKILACVRPDMAGAATSGGEWTARAAGEREATILGDVVGEWLAHGENRKTIAFGADIAYCNELVKRFNGAGIAAQAYTSQTPDVERVELVKEFEKPDSSIRVLASVAALARGFDVPDIGCIIDARPLRKSLSEVIQMWGRGLRCAPAKQDCILLDHAGNAIRFMEDFERVYFEGFKSLDDGEKADRIVRKEPEDYVPKGCPQCGHKPFSRHCLACGFERQSVADTDEQSGVMTEIRIGKRVAATSERDLWNQLATQARHSPGIVKKFGWCWYKFKEITGQKPPSSFSFEDAPDVPVTAATIGKLKQLHIRYRHRRAREADHAPA